MVNIDKKILDEIIEYIEDSARGIDGEIYCRSLQELIEDGDMPEIYSKLIELRNENRS